MPRKNFIRQPEDFICENCGTPVQGDGYTNHCPKCLFSKHVDNVPGDRANLCGGLMEPVSVQLKGGLPDKIVHQCLKCGHIHKNKISPQDNQTSLLNLHHE
ncbi:MAG: RNHCP domain-containing protein [Patescibacteria group bacterium]|nr:RNHCP domain-containing protein [Patescibacteria group bacterium]